MKPIKIHMPNLSQLAAFVIGVILFAVFWKMLFGSASGLVLLAGMIGAAVAVALFRLGIVYQNHLKKDR